MIKAQRTTRYSQRQPLHITGNGVYSLMNMLSALWIRLNALAQQRGVLDRTFVKLLHYR